MPADPHWSDALVRLHACPEALAYARTQPDFASAWRRCKRGDWMLWIAARAGVDRRVLVRAANACARTALPCMREEDLLAVLLCLHITDEWIEGRADDEDVRAGRSVAARRIAAAADAAAAAADAASADAAYYAAAYAASAASARARTLAESARIVRRILPCPVLP